MKKIIISLLFLQCSMSFYVKAQSADTLIISPLVGSIIDSAEKVQSHIFPYYSSKIFILAVFLRNADSSITLRALLKPDSIAEKQISKQEYEWIRNLVEAAPDANSSLPPSRRKKPYDVKITLLNGETRSGILYKVNYNTVATSKTEIPVSNIKSIQLVRQNGVGRGIGNGFLIGMGVGMLLGLADGSDPAGGFLALDAYEKGIYAGIILSVPGMLIGGIVGAFPVGIHISLDGSQSKYESIRNNLRTYSSNK